jgi:hypothetical protein
MSESIKVIYPFVREAYQAFGPNGYEDLETWRPGVRFEHVGSEDLGSVADGVGHVVYTEISRHKPGKYPTRVFFTRSWIDPDGNAFGNSCLRIVTLQKFNRLIAGYRYRYGIGEPRRFAWNPMVAEREFAAELAKYLEASK